MMVATPTATDALASFVASLTYESIPSAVRERVKDLLLDALASGLAGTHSDEVAQIRALAEAIGGGDGARASVIGDGWSSPAGAALLNGYLITAATVCDVHRPTLCHVTPEVVPPALIVAEDRALDGKALITAIAAGLEVTTRVGLGSDYPVFRKHGWHSPGVVGPFGGAASAGKLLGLDQHRQRNALGLAGSQSAGTFAAWGTPTIKFHQSRGSLSGLLAATLAETGFEAAADILGAEDGGLYRTYAEGGKPEAVTDGLGTDWELMDISLRRWPVASSIQSMVTALFAILGEHEVDRAQIACVRVRLSDTVYRMHGELGWDTRFRALLSARYVVSVVVHDRRCWLDQFTAGRIRDPQLDAFARERVEVSVSDDLPTNGASVEVEMSDGRRLTDRRDHPKGDALDPLSRQEIGEKVHDAARGILDDAKASQLIGSIGALEEVADVRTVTASMRVLP
jgi:2-methylcitrate dehydratase PrpD